MGNVELGRPLGDADLGHLIAEARAAAGLTQLPLAARIGTAQPVISRWERGFDSPRVDTLVRVLRACGFEPELVLRPIERPVPEGESISP